MCTVKLIFLIQQFLFIISTNTKTKQTNKKQRESHKFKVNTYNYNYTYVGKRYLTSIHPQVSQRKYKSELSVLTS